MDKGSCEGQKGWCFVKHEVVTWFRLWLSGRTEIKNPHVVHRKTETLPSTPDFPQLTWL